MELIGNEDLEEAFQLGANVARQRPTPKATHLIQRRATRDGFQFTLRLVVGIADPLVDRGITVQPLFGHLGEG